MPQHRFVVNLIDVVILLFTDLDLKMERFSRNHLDFRLEVKLSTRLSFNVAVHYQFDDIIYLAKFRNLFC